MVNSGSLEGGECAVGGGGEVSEGRHSADGGDDAGRASRAKETASVDGDEANITHNDTFPLDKMQTLLSSPTAATQSLSTSPVPKQDESSGGSAGGNSTVTKPSTVRKLLCLYCERSFVSATLRQKHVERVHSVKQSRRISSRRQSQLTVTPCVYCDHQQPDNTLDDLFRHLVQEHSNRYFGCLTCRDRFLSPAMLADHNSANHPTKDAPSQPDTQKIQATAVEEQTTKGTEEHREDPEIDEEVTVKITRSRIKKAEEISKKPGKLRDLRSRRVKKITDHSIDNLKISSLTFDDVFDKAFFNRIKCNIEENLLHHIDGKLFKNQESETRISNFEKVSTTPQESQSSNPENFGCELSLNAVTPVASLSLNSQFGEDFESQIEYGAKPSKKKTQNKKDEEEASKKAALDKLNSLNPERSISPESFMEVREVLNEILNKVFAITEQDCESEILGENTSRCEDVRKIPRYLNLRPSSSLPTDGDIDHSDKITLICSSRETDNFELPTNPVRSENELVELSGEWARCRMYDWSKDIDKRLNLPNAKNTRNGLKVPDRNLVTILNSLSH
ncbi:unnamed protein product [Acanthoscelides obtectus]|uniref:C2H2-type domain-containing protein n=1 Tax=Acanthoscelides obtectus TaxID=200917 RepID=A0A9P0JGS3_ACAOB|nr:unnamed protein product [Acanthoscelides obtectus]CAK1639668.1 hypothetical protein AOBTE_LOCUS11303 [Acanthoscelides obtectus]